jgi:glycosyltransferase involved in cell wall biosynthesis
LRVLVFTPSYPRYRGDYHGSFVQALCGRLAGHVDLTVLAPRSRTMGPFPEPYPVHRFPYLPRSCCELLAEMTMVDAPASHIVQLPMYLASAYLHSLKGSYDLVHTHLAIPLGLLAAHNPRGTPQLVTCHGSDCTLPARNGFIAPTVRHALRKADRVVAVSEAVKERALRLGARRDSTETIYLGVDVERFTPPRKRRGPPTVGVL